MMAAPITASPNGRSGDLLRAKGQSGCRIDIGRVVVVDRKERDVYDSRCFQMRSQLNGIAAVEVSARDDLKLRVSGTRKV